MDAIKIFLTGPRDCNYPLANGQTSSDPIYHWVQMGICAAFLQALGPTGLHNSMGPVTSSSRHPFVPRPLVGVEVQQHVNFSMPWAFELAPDIRDIYETLAGHGVMADSSLTSMVWEAGLNLGTIPDCVVLYLEPWGAPFPGTWDLEPEQVACLTQARQWLYWPQPKI